MNSSVRTGDGGAGSAADSGSGSNSGSGVGGGAAWGASTGRRRLRQPSQPANNAATTPAPTAGAAIVGWKGADGALGAGFGDGWACVCFGSADAGGGAEGGAGWASSWACGGGVCFAACREGAGREVTALSAGESPSVATELALMAGGAGLAVGDVAAGVGAGDGAGVDVGAGEGAAVCAPALNAAAPAHSAATKASPPPLLRHLPLRHIV